ncbi:short-chain dehydrogenase [Coprinopsis sp. MPI-PUGE-AT-0042]|nr:short-chain dehydrogenase [Coprinopsis sp. MPI-PUGE-AT-0042]
MKLSFWQFFTNQRKAVPPVPVADLTGKTVLITGANTGLGYEACEAFRQHEPGKVIIACRSKAKGDEAVTRLKNETGFSNIHLRVLDLGSFSSTIDFANKFEQEEERLDILVANAAIGREDYVTTDDGWESRTGKTFSVEPRLVVVASGMHYWTKLEEKVVNSPEPLKTFSSKEYCTPSILEKTPVVANLVCPGYCHSELRRELEMQWSKRMMFSIMDKVMARTSDEGARQYVWAALADNTDGRMRGAYCDSMRILETSDYSLSKEGLAV